MTAQRSGSPHWSQRRGSLARAGAAWCWSRRSSFDSFATFDNAAATSRSRASFLAIVALGMTFVIITGGIDLSVGSVFALGGVARRVRLQWGASSALLLPLRGVRRDRAAQRAARSRTAGWRRSSSRWPACSARAGCCSRSPTRARRPTWCRATRRSGARPGHVPRPRLPGVDRGRCCSRSAACVLQRTRFGHARVRGRRQRGRGHADGPAGGPRSRCCVYLLSGLLAGLAGALNAARLGSGVTIVGVGMELDAIAAVVIGGTLLTGGAGTVGGTLAGVLLLRRHPERDQPDRHADLALPVGGQRRVPGRRRCRAGISQPRLR